jgi:uncharacterized membrane protein YtjA (UPF0391 family)
MRYFSCFLTVAASQKYVAPQQRSAWNFSLSGIFMAKGFIVGTHPPGADFKICEEKAMLNLVVTLLIIALIAAVLGFGGIAVAAVGIAKIVFFVALVLFLIALLAGTMRGPRVL